MKTFEEELGELERLVASLEKGDVPLDEAMKTFEKGMILSKNLTQTLANAEEKIAKIMKDNVEVAFEE
jgi:exodeoxyribonuclease VII small subunit